MVSVREAAKILRVSESTVWRWINEGLLRSFRLGPKRIWLRRADLGEMAVPGRTHGRPSDDEIRRHLSPIAPEAHKMTRKEFAAHSAKLLAEVAELRRQGKPLWNSADAINDAREEYSSGV